MDMVFLEELNNTQNSFVQNESYVESRVLSKTCENIIGIENNSSQVSFDKNSDKNNKDILIQQYKTEILSVIREDVFEDAIETKSECYIRENYNDYTYEYIKPALMELYLDNLSNAHILTGLLMMIGTVSYDRIAPEGQVMAMGLLQNMHIPIRDKAIQAFERWNSKKGISVLSSLKCDRKWLQRYVDKVIMYIEKDGID